MTARPMVPLTIAFVAGIIVERYMLLPWWWLSAVMASLLLVKAFRPAMIALALVLCAACGVLAYRSYTALSFNDVSLSPAARPGRDVTLAALVRTPPERTVLFGKAVRVRFIAQAIEVNGQKVSGRVLVDMFRAEDIRYGDVLDLSGRFGGVPSGGSRGRLSYVDTLARQKVRTAFCVKKSGRCRVIARDRGHILTAAAQANAVWLNGIFERYLSPGEAGLMNAFITGERRGIGSHVKEIFRRTGTTHIIAVSGMNIGMVAVGIFFVLALLPVPRRGRMVCAILITSWYAYVAGGSSPVVRAAVMSAIFLMSTVIEREQDSINTLSASALAILVVNPTQLFDVGFQLSFAGVSALVLIAPLLIGLWGTGEQSRLWQEYLGVSLAAFLGTSGITAYYFGTLCPVSILANIPSVPLVGVITALGGLLLVVSGIPLLGGLVALVLKAALNLLVYLLYLIALIPGGLTTLDPLPGFWSVIAYYVLLGILVWSTRRFARPVDPRWAII